MNHLLYAFHNNFIYIFVCSILIVIGYFRSTIPEPEFNIKYLFSYYVCGSSHKFNNGSMYKNMNKIHYIRWLAVNSKIWEFHINKSIISIDYFK